MSNLRLINDTSFSGVATASVTDVFTAEYDIYKVVATDYQQTSGTAGRARLRFINPSGSIISASNYDHASWAMEAAGSYVDVNEQNVSYIDWLLYDNGETGGASASVWWIFSPFINDEYSFVKFQEAHYQASYGPSSEIGVGILKQAASMSGYSIYGSNGGSFNVRFRTYGLRVDS